VPTFAIQKLKTIIQILKITVMKKITRKAIVLLMAITIATSIFGQQKRYVFALGGFPTTDPGWQSSWVDYRLDDLNRVLYIWPDGSTLAGVPAVGTGSLGQSSYLAFTVGNVGWWGCGYYVGPDSGNSTATMDLTDVTSSWTFHFAIRTDCAQDITITLVGTTIDPTDPFITTYTSGKVVLDKTLLPLSKRDKTQWVEFNIPMSQLMTNSVVATNNLVYKAPVAKNNYITFAGGNDTGSFIAWDNVYLGAPTTAVNQVLADKLDISVIGNELTVNNNTNPVNIFNVNGARVLTSNQNTVDISNLASGIYIVKAGNRVSKFNK
jgi:hypothetical protein